MPKLVQGDKLPQLTFKLIDGSDLVVPDALDGHYLALLFYRGNW